MTTTAERTLSTRCRGLVDALQGVVALDPAVATAVVAAVLARGHVLIEGIPGIGKTLLARTLAKAIGCSFHRIQFTNDLMPSDVVGSLVWRAGKEQFTFVRGPLFAQVVLADEINRTSPRTLSCLLEAMEAGRVSVEGRTLPLSDPFLVLATRNPIEFQGTYPIPEAALDRFLLRVELGYPTRAQELDLLLGRDAEAALDAAEPVLDVATLLAAMAAVREVVVSEPVANYAYDVATATREHQDVTLGASPRATLMWLRAARAIAFLDGRDHLLPDDLKVVAEAVLAHRLVVRAGVDARSVVTDAIARSRVAL